MGSVRETKRQWDKRGSLWLRGPRLKKLFLMFLDHNELFEYAVKCVASRKKGAKEVKANDTTNIFWGSKGFLNKRKSL